MSELLQNLGLEDDTSDELVITDIDTTPEDDLLDANDEGDQMEVMTDRVEDITEDADTLEDVAIALESALSTGKIDPQLLSFARVTVSRIENRWKLPKSPIASMESFDKDEAEALRMSLEGIGDLLTSIWDSIAEGFRAIRRTFKNLIIKIMDASAKIGKEAAELQRKAKASSAKGGGKVGFSNKGLYLDGTAPEPKVLLAGMKNLYTRAEFCLGTHDDIPKKLNQICIDIAKSVVDAQDDGYAKTLKEGVKGFKDAFQKIAELSSGSKTSMSSKESGAGVDVYLSGEFPGGKTIRVKDATVQTAWFEAITTIAAGPAGIIGRGLEQAFIRSPIDYVVRSHSIDIGNYRKSTPRNGSYVALSANECAQIAGNVVDLCDLVYFYKRRWEKREGQEERHFETIQREIGSPEGINPFKRRVVTSVATASQTLWRKTMSFDKDFMSYILKTCRLANMYVKASLKVDGSSE